MAPVQNPVIPKASLILVTGANGFIGSHVANEALSAGYRVRGTVRSVKKNNWLVEVFAKYGNNAFELVEVDDMGAEGAFDEAIKGVTGVAHVASVMPTDPDPSNVIPKVVAGAVNALKAAAKEPSVMSFVYTSSSTAATMPIPNLEFSIDENSWNEEAIKAAWAPPPYAMDRKWVVYGASKAQTEQEVWRWYKEHKPSFILNTVLPNCNFGPSIDLQHQGHPSSSRWISAVFSGQLEAVASIPPNYHIDVRDTALLHLAALTLPHVQNERIFGFADAFNWNDVLRIFRELYPDRKFAGDISSLPRDLSNIIPAPRAEQLLKDMGRPGWRRLEESVKANVE